MSEPRVIIPVPPAPVDKVELLKSHVNAYTRKDGAVVAAHDDKRTKNPAADEVTHDSLKKHPMYSESDHSYFKGKGYEPKEIKNIWDRDHKAGHAPVQHDKAPDVVGAITGHKDGK